jgi:DNA polymerase
MTDFLFLDFETKSRRNLKQCGLDTYARDPSTKVLMLGYAFNDYAPGLYQPHVDGRIPERLLRKLRDPSVMIVAHNAVFDRKILKHVMGIDIPIERFICTMAMALYLALPAALHQLTHDALVLGPEFAKDREGDRLIRVFCIPSNAKQQAKTGREFNDWDSHPEDWHRFGDYCRRDVVAERKVYCILRKYIVDFDRFQAEYGLDQEINDKGLPLDLDLITGAEKIRKEAGEFYKRELQAISGLANPNSTQQALGWLQERGYPFASLKKNRVKIAMKDFGDQITAEAKLFLDVRLKSNRAAVKKFAAFLRAHSDGYVRGMFQFCGAGRTGRWAGRVVQLQNLTKALKSVEKFLDSVRDMIRDGDTDGLRFIFDNPLDVLVSSVRSSICAPDGYELAIADLSSIELAVAAWGPKCKFWLDVLREKKDPYCAFGVYLYDEDYETLYHEYKVLKNKKRRDGAKPGALGAQFRLGGGELRGTYPDQERTGLWGYAQSMGVDLTQEFSKHAVTVYRELSPEIVQEWYDLENAARDCIQTREPQMTPSGVRFDMKPPFMRMRLPSGRYLFYCQPKMLDTKIKTGRMVPVFDGEGKEIGQEEETFEKFSISYMGLHQTSKKWVRLFTHGGKLFENWVQAVARDLLVYGMFEARDFGFDLRGHVHDELIALVRRCDIRFNVENLVRCMSKVPEWAEGLPLGAAGFQQQFYAKE